MSSELEVEEALLGLARGAPDKLIAVMASGQNVDRLVSCYKAAYKSDRLLVLDPYQAFVLHELAPLSANIPQFTWDRIRVGILKHQMEAIERSGLTQTADAMRAASVESRDLIHRPGQHFVVARGSRKNANLLTAVGADNVELVWSLWKGYWSKPKCAMRSWAEHNDVEPHFVHSGGHAWPGDLARLVEAIDPGEAVPVHTDNRERAS